MLLVVTMHYVLEMGDDEYLTHENLVSNDLKDMVQIRQYVS